jgi:23S rRNA (pseudouridine1915-N3)-methyltransferase
MELAEFLEKRSVEGVGEMCFVIGGPDGHSEHIKERADFLWSLSRLTFPHDMAMVIFAETLYRASTINKNHPYHRE